MQLPFSKHIGAGSILVFLRDLLLEIFSFECAQFGVVYHELGNVEFERDTGLKRIRRDRDGARDAVVRYHMMVTETA